MIYIFSPNATPTDLLTNGYGILECTSCSVYEELNGEFSCFVSIPLDTKNEEYFVGDAIVKIPTHRGVQYFRLQVPETQLTGKTATGYHISYDMSNDMILNGYISASDGDTALNYILNSGTYEDRFSGSSDISIINNARIVRTPLLSALMDGGRNNSFVSRWGGEIERDNFTFNINTRLGADNGARVSYKKNLSGLRITEDYTKIATRIYPTCLKADDTVLIYSGSGYIDSPELSTYPMPKIKHIHYSDIKVGAEVDGSVLYPDEASAIAEMLARVQALYAAGQDKPQVTVEASVANLPEYAELNLGDTVKGGFRDWVFNHRVVSVNYDGLYDRMISVTLGAVKSSFQGTMYAQTAQVQAISDSLEGVVYQGEKYNEVYIDHTNGFVAECSALNVRMVSNAGTIGFYDMTTDEFIGGLAVRDGKVSLLTDSVGTVESTDDFLRFELLDDTNFAYDLYGYVLYAESRRGISFKSHSYGAGPSYWAEIVAHGEPDSHDAMNFRIGATTDGDYAGENGDAWTEYESYSDWYDTEPTLRHFVKTTGGEVTSVKLYPGGYAFNGQEIYHTKRLQAGTITLNSSGSVNLNFATEFDHSPFVVVTPVTTTSGVIAAKVTEVDTDHFRAVLGGTGFSDIVCHWIAIDPEVD